MKIALAQINSTVGAAHINAKKILEHYIRATESGADLVIFPELCLSGYGIGDLLINEGFLLSLHNETKKLAISTLDRKSSMLVGSPVKQDGKIYNSAILIGNGEILNLIHKRHLPNYGEFDELRNFEAAHSYHKPITICGQNVGIIICEDIWFDDVIENYVENGVELLIVINCSPFDIAKQERRSDHIRHVIKKWNLPVIYLNRIGSDDSLVFDGGSFILDSDGKSVMLPQYWEENLYYCDYQDHKITSSQDQPIIQYDKQHNIYQALLLGLRDYCEKNRFQKVLLGLSGGIDSALIAVLAADCLGSDAVTCIALPSHISSESSFNDANILAKNIGCHLEKIDISVIYSTIEHELSFLFKNTHPDQTEENIQARIRGLVLMAISNKFNSLLLATGNKSELATGYCTLYGDMCGGYAPIKDLYKTQVYQLAAWRNKNIPQNSKLRITNPIPEEIIIKEPTAELRIGQKDLDSLPPYDILDAILYKLIELDMSPKDISFDLQLDLSLVSDIAKKLRISEYKRRQGALGPKISIRELVIQRRYPLTNMYQEGNH